MWNIILVWTAVVGESEEWSSQYIFQFKQLERRSLKKIRASTGFEPVTSSKCRYDALPTELWSHTLEARSVCWVHISRKEWSGVNGSIHEIIHMWTAVVDKGEEWSSQRRDMNSTNWPHSQWKIYCDDYSSLSLVTLVMAPREDVADLTLCGSRKGKIAWLSFSNITHFTWR